MVHIANGSIFLVFSPVSQLQYFLEHLQSCLILYFLMKMKKKEKVKYWEQFIFVISSCFILRHIPKLSCVTKECQLEISVHSLTRSIYIILGIVKKKRGGGCLSSISRLQTQNMKSECEALGVSTDYMHMGLATRFCTQL